LVSDPDALHGYLDRDVTTWGQFRSAFDRGGGTWLRATDDDYRKLAARAAVLSSMLEYGRIGHGRPCSRLELAGSPVGASSLLPQVGDLLDLCDGDAQALCTRLKNREVQGLRTKTVDDLEAFCRERGYIVDDPKLATDEIRMRVSIDHRAPVEQGLLTDADIDRLFADFSTLTVTEPLVMQGIGE
jgi:hypothetical protein